MTLTRIDRFPDLTAPCQARSPAFASITAPLSKSDLPSLNAFHAAAARNVCSVHPVIRGIIPCPWHLGNAFGGIIRWLHCGGGIASFAG